MGLSFIVQRSGFRICYSLKPGGNSPRFWTKPGSLKADLMMWTETHSREILQEASGNHWSFFTNEIYGFMQFVHFFLNQFRVTVHGAVTIKLVSEVDNFGGHLWRFQPQSTWYSWEAKRLALNPSCKAHWYSKCFKHTWTLNIPMNGPWKCAFFTAHVVLTRWV